MVYYRKYRPQKIEELDNREVREKLFSVLKSSEVSHAFLFTGPKGLGKTSTARIVAKVLNCKKKGKSIEPCNKCNQCKSITNGTNLDVLEIDGASNRGIDEIRDLREKVKLSPIAGRKKVYIIDEVHMLTTEAFNALLKTLEEPPNHVVFILCTTEPHKVPETIASRCLQIKFTKATSDELVRSFERILKGEKIKFDSEALKIIASLSDGSFRDGAKILEEMTLVSKGKKITKELVEEKYQISSIEYKITQTVKYLEEKDTKNALSSIAELVDDGVDMANFLEKFIKTLHNSLLFKMGITSGIQNSEFRIQNLRMEVSELKQLIELLSKAYGELKYSVLPQIPLELVVVEWGMQSKKNDDASLVRGPVTRFPPESSPLTVRAVGRSPTSSTTPRLDKNPNPFIAQQDMTKYNENDALRTALIDKVKSYNHSIAGVLRGCSIKSYDKKNLVIQANFKFHQDKLNEPKTHEILEKVLREITKKNISVEVVLRG